MIRKDSCELTSECDMPPFCMLVQPVADARLGVEERFPSLSDASLFPIDLRIDYLQCLPYDRGASRSRARGTMANCSFGQTRGPTALRAAQAPCFQQFMYKAAPSSLCHNQQAVPPREA